MPPTSQETLRTGCVLLPSAEVGVFAIEGKDAPGYLHRQMSNEVRNLPPNGCVDTCFLDPQAHIRLYFHLWKQEEGGFRAVVLGQQRHRFIESLEQFVFTEEIRFKEEVAERTSLLVAGPGAIDALNQVLEATLEGIPPKTARCSDWNGEPLWMGSYSWLHVPVYQILCRKESAVALAESLREAGAIQGDWVDFHTLRIEKGTPWPGFEVEETLVPFECGLSGAVSLTKGCYVGQEIIARMFNLGKPPRELRGLLLEGMAPPEVGASVLKDDVEIGKVLSSGFSERLGGPIATSSLRKSFLEEGTLVSVSGFPGSVRFFPMTSSPPV